MIKYSMRDGVEWQIQHEAKPSAVFATRPHPECCILSYSTSIEQLMYFWSPHVFGLNYFKINNLTKRINTG